MVEGLHLAILTKKKLISFKFRITASPILKRVLYKSRSRDKRPLTYIAQARDCNL